MCVGLSRTNLKWLADVQDPLSSQRRRGISLHRYGGKADLRNILGQLTFIRLSECFMADTFHSFDWPVVTVRRALSETHSSLDKRLMETIWGKECTPCGVWYAFNNLISINSNSRFYFFLHKCLEICLILCMTFTMIMLVNLASPCHRWAGDQAALEVQGCCLIQRGFAHTDLSVNWTLFACLSPLSFLCKFPPRGSPGSSWKQVYHDL